MTKAEKIAKAFHNAYERLAPSFGYETRRASAKPWEEVPADNKQLMIAVVKELLEAGWISSRVVGDAEAGRLRRSVGEPDELVGQWRSLVDEEW